MLRLIILCQLLAASCTTLGPITKFDRQPNSQIPAHAPLTAKRCLDLLNLSFDSDLNADIVDRILGFEQFGPDQIPATFMKPLLEHLLAHPEWTPVKRALFWQHSSIRLNHHLTSGFVSRPDRGSNGPMCFKGISEKSYCSHLMGESTVHHQLPRRPISTKACSIRC